MEEQPQTNTESRKSYMKRPIPEALDTSESRGTIGVVTEKKQHVDEPDENVPKSQDVVRNPYVIYPDQYDDFDTKLICFAKDPQPSKEGVGQILFMSYQFKSMGADGVPRVVTKPLLINTPNGMCAPVGITAWPDGKSSVLLSCGRDWYTYPLLVKFKHILDLIQQRCCDVAVEKQWNSPGINQALVVRELFADIMFMSTDASGENYPPSIKATVIMSGHGRSELFEYALTPPLHPMVPSDVVPGSSMTSVIHISWMYRKKVKKGWAFSIRSTLFQSVVGPPKPYKPSVAPRDGCYVVVQASPKI